jgi:hypothetical protein
MANNLPLKMLKGTIGELLVQLRLLEYGVQSVPPLKDTGNDLIAIRGEIVKFIQVKTGKQITNLPLIYHIVALVNLKYADDSSLSLDQSEIYFVDRGETVKEKKRLTKELVDSIWPSY